MEIRILLVSALAEAVSVLLGSGWAGPDDDADARVDDESVSITVVLDV